MDSEQGASNHEFKSWAFESGLPLLRADHEDEDDDECLTSYAACSNMNEVVLTTNPLQSLSSLSSPALLDLTAINHGSPVISTQVVIMNSATSSSSSMYPRFTLLDASNTFASDMRKNVNMGMPLTTTMNSSTNTHHAKLASVRVEPVSEEAVRSMFRERCRVSPEPVTNVDEQVAPMKAESFPMNVKPEPIQPALSNGGILANCTNNGFPVSQPATHDLPVQHENIKDEVRTDFVGKSKTPKRKAKARESRPADEERIRRPPNYYNLYVQANYPAVQEELSDKNRNFGVRHVSPVIGERWRNESEEVKDYYREKAKKLALEHSMKYPNYKYNPKKSKTKRQHE